MNSNELINLLLQFQLSVKFWHWNSETFAQHKAFDKLYKSLGDNIDLLAESTMGLMDDKKYYEFPDNYYSTDNIKLIKIEYKISIIHSIYDYLERFSKDDTDNIGVQNILANIITDLDQTKYLLTLK